MSDLENRTRYEPAEAEPRVFERWEASGRFHPEPTGSPEENFSIAIPPPNVTGALHMGHALNGSIQDALMRHARMQGRNAKWILGTDHAGIATQTQVERALKAEGTSKEELGREKFLERMWEWRHQYGGTIISQYRRLGASVDYEDERFTLDDRYVQAVLKVFVDLYDKDLIYRDNYMVNWDPGSRSAISDLEVEEREVSDTLYWIDYPLEGCSGTVTVATVRPETMLADTAIAVHPDDDRYTRLVGETAILPLVGRRLKIIADPYVKPEFGTGALKITPAHDANDFEIGRAHGLEEVSVIGEDGRMTEAAGERFAGLTALEAREAVVEALRAEGRIVKTEPYTHNVPFSHRSGERIEPLISLQWFCRMDELAGAGASTSSATAACASRPEGQRRRYFDWMENIRPWCISRQLWWGHRIPVWYRGGEIYCGVEPPRGDGWEQDPDVLDTWFSSGLWPFATLGWPDDTPELRAFYPTDFLLDGARHHLPLGRPHDHVRARVRGRHPVLGRLRPPDHPGPRRPADVEVARHRHRPARPDRRRPRPIFTLPPTAPTPLRFGLLAMSSSQDVRFNEDKVAQGRQLTNKLWNASRLLLLRVPDELPEPQRGHGRGRVDPLAAAAGEGGDREGVRGLRVPPRRARALRLRLRRPLRLVPRADQAAAVRRRQRRGQRGRAARPARDARARPPGDPVRHRGDLVLPAGHRGPADGAAWPTPDEALVDAGAEAELARAIARGPGAARVARPRRRGARPHARGAAGGRGLRAHRRRGRAAGARRVDRERHAPGSRPSRSRAATSPSSPPTRSTPRPRPSAPPPSGRAWRARSSAPRASSPTRASSPRRRRRSSQAERDKLARLQAELEALG